MGLRTATENLIAFEAALEDGTVAADAVRQAVVAGYNEDDCRATLALRDWLEDRRRDLAERVGHELPRPLVVEAVRAPADPEVTRIRSALLAGVSAETSARTDEERARALLADLIDWHRREDKPAWWRYFYLRGLSSAELTRSRRHSCGGGSVISGFRSYAEQAALYARYVNSGFDPRYIAARPGTSSHERGQAVADDDL